MAKRINENIGRGTYCGDRDGSGGDSAGIGGTGGKGARGEVRIWSIR